MRIPILMLYENEYDIDTHTPKNSMSMELIMMSNIVIYMGKYDYFLLKNRFGRDSLTLNTIEEIFDTDVFNIPNEYCEILKAELT